MPTRITIDDDITIALESPKRYRPRGCQWDEGVCTTAPEYRIAGVGERHSGHTHEAEVHLYCARHYALALARLVETHLFECERPLLTHAAIFENVEDGR